MREKQRNPEKRDVAERLVDLDPETQELIERIINFAEGKKK
ncbi:hypothetical protein [Rhizobium leguminosarum]|nr:hypothetical protein [Rhizobium leguminosarum]